MCSLAFKVFVILYVVALLIWLAGTFGWFGTQTDPLSGVFLAILGLPWNRLVDFLPESFWSIGGALAPLINAGLIYAICGLLRRGN